MTTIAQRITAAATAFALSLALIAGTMTASLRAARQVPTTISGCRSSART